MGGLRDRGWSSPERRRIVHLRMESNRALAVRQKFLLLPSVKRTRRREMIEKKKPRSGGASKKRATCCFQPVARKAHDVANAGKDEAGDPASKDWKKAILPSWKARQWSPLAELHRSLVRRCRLLRIDRQAFRAVRSSRGEESRCNCNTEGKRHPETLRETQPPLRE